jgi:MYXO-CTERM domain-containing protein
LAAGTHAITATYPGTAHLHASTSAELSQVVTANGASVALDSSANPSIAGGIVKLTATVTGTGATPTGSMTFSENGTTLSTVALDGSAKAALDMPSLTVGTHSIVATYGGDGLYPAGSTATLVQVVDKAATLTVVASSVNPSGPGQEVMLTATVTSSFAGVTGTVELFDGAVSLGTATLAGGQATLAVSSLTIGSHAITAGYSGDDAHVGSTSAVLTQNVSADAGVGDGGATDGGVDDAAGSDGALADVSAGDAAKSDAAVGDAAKADAPAIDGSARSDGGAGGNGGAGGAGGTSVVGDASALGDAPDAPEPGAALDVGESSGCGCRTASSRTSGVWLLGLAAVAAVVARRRRR